MNHRGAEIPERKAPRVVMTLYALYLCASPALGATDSSPRRYNEGVTAYKSNDFVRATAMFETATASRDRALQQRSLYNLGNTEYRLGQTQPARAQQLWERALKNYETAMALDPRDADAKFNRDFVKKKLEELKKQQQEQTQNDQEQQQQKQNQEQQNSKDKQSEKQKQPQQPQSQQSQEQQEQKDKQQAQQTQQPKSAPPEQKPPEKGAEPENYDKMQATALLNELRENERNWNFFPEVQMKDLKDSGKPAKDW